MINKDFIRDFAFFSLAMVLFLTGSHAFAQDAAGIQGAMATDGSGSGSTLGDLFSNSCTNTIPFITLISYICDCAGVMAVLAGIHYTRLHVDSPTNHPINKALMLFAGGAGLMVMPAIMMTAASSLGYASDSALAGCMTTGGGSSTSASGSTGLDGMLENFIGNVKAPLMALIQVIANVVGVFMLANGLLKASKYGFDPKTNSIHSILTNIVFGALLFTIGSNFALVSASIFGTAPSDEPILAWSSTVTSGLGGASAQFTAAVNACLSFIQIIGFIAFVRGWMIMKKVVEGGSGNVTPAQGITHIVGGVLAINITSFLQAMDTTFGTNMLSS